MSTTIEATYDGQVFRPTGPVPLQPNTSVRLTVEPLTTANNAATDYPEADFYTPVQYNWSDFTYQVDQALEVFNGQIHANR